MNKQSILKAMTAAGAFAPFRWANVGGALVLLYHRFGTARDGVTVSAREFDRQVQYLKARYQLVPLSAIAAYLQGQQRWPRRLAAITVDDGYQDFYEVAFPILQRHRVPATLFAVSAFVEQQSWMPTDRAIYCALSAASGAYEFDYEGHELRLTLGNEASRLAAATWVNLLMRQLPVAQQNELLQRFSDAVGVELSARPPQPFNALKVGDARAMWRAGIEIGSHSQTHPLLTQTDDATLEREMADSRAQLEQMLGASVTGFAYPHGDVDERVQAAARRAGYSYAASSAVGINSLTSDLFGLQRVQAEPDLPHFVQVSSGCEQVKNRLRQVMTGQRQPVVNEREPKNTSRHFTALPQGQSE